MNPRTGSLIMATVVKRELLLSNETLAMVIMITLVRVDK